MSVTLSIIREAAERIKNHVHRTPVVTNATIDKMMGCTMFFKCENLQKVGAFKARGATNAIMQLTADQAQRGVVTHSSGNHAQALAYAAKQFGIACTVVMPDSSPSVKVDATRGYGAHVVFCENTLIAREETLKHIVDTTNATEIHPYNNDQVIAGQGTAALELLEQVGDLDAVIAPVGGGGLMSGTAITCRTSRPPMQIWGAEPELAADAKKSIESKQLQAPFPPITIADGLRTALCDRTLGYLLQHDVTVITAKEDAILDAMHTLISRLKLVVEPSGAVPVAAMMEHKDLFTGKRVGVILSGGNVELVPKF
ncbi:MAG: threonine/serine dehydratase [Bradyrhizobiaceae bacterium]|nr:threonine/serine dehydratase [Bradyrhizobiaceae bacterium]